MDSVLGNIGASLRVGDEDEDEDHIAEGDTGTQDMEFVHTQTSVSAVHEELGTAAQLPASDRTTEGIERIIGEIGLGGENKAAIPAQASDVLQV